MAATAILDFQNVEILGAGRLKTAKMRHRAKFRGDRSNRCWDMAIFRFFQDGGRPPSWICDERVWTTHEGNLVVFITVQNLVAIDAAVLIICMFFDFTSLTGERLFTPPKWGFWGFDPLNGETYQRNSQKAQDVIIMTYRSSKSFQAGKHHRTLAGTYFPSC